MVPWCQEFTIFPHPKTSTSGVTQLKEQCQVTRQNWLDRKDRLSLSLKSTSLTHPVQQTPNVLQAHLLIFILCSLPLCLCKCLPGLLQYSFTVFTLSPLFLSPSALTLQSGRSLYFKKLSVAPNAYSLNSLADLTRPSGPHLLPTSMFISICVFPKLLVFFYLWVCCFLSMEYLSHFTL